MSVGSPIMLRIFKKENVLEVWKQDHTKRYALLNSYEICKWSGKYGPKLKEGDKQAPEGFYHVTKALMNPNSSYHLSFNMGYPNKFDRSHGRTGSYLMIHGACSSAGCYSMTDEYVEEIYSLAREAFKGGQEAFQIQAFPFRMTPENLAEHVGHKDFDFWKMLKEGSDHFEVTRQQPKVDVCEKRYVFNRLVEEGEQFNSRQVCPPAKIPRSLALAFNEKQNKDQSVFDKVLKRAANNPFTAAENRPQISTASIKAEATEGPLEVFVPQPVTVVAAKPDQEQPDETAGNEAVANGETAVETREANPISAEITGLQTDSQIAVPQKATRQ